MPEKNLCIEEEVVSKVLAKHKLRLDTEISFGRVGHDRKYPYIKAASLVKSLERHGKLSRLLGFEHLGPEYNYLAACGDLLEDFWRKYRPLHDTHEVFARADAGAIQLRNCVPVYLHGDEGTTYKKDGCLVLSIHTPLGAGTVSQKMGPVANERDVARTNFAGNALETRFMLAALLKDSWIERKQGKQYLWVSFAVVVCSNIVDAADLFRFVLLSCNIARKITGMTIQPTTRSWNWWLGLWMMPQDRVWNWQQVIVCTSSLWETRGIGLT